MKYVVQYVLTVIVTLLVVGGLSAALTFGLHVHQPTPEEIGEEVIARANAEREALGRQPMAVSDLLMTLAQWRSDDMIGGGYVGHVPPEGHPTLRDMCRELEYEGLCWPGENIVTMGLEFGRTDDVVERAIESWRGSPGHWRWLTSEHNEVTGVGVAVDGDRVVITQLFWAHTPEGPKH